MNRRIPSWNPPRSFLRHLFFAAFLQTCLPWARSETLPIQHFSTAGGLAQDLVSCVVQDSRGFLWFCTGEGVSRFDGYSFTSFGDEEGLPGKVVSDLIESHDGAIWIATDDGLARLDPPSLFRTASDRPAGPPRTTPSHGGSRTLFRTFRPKAGAGARALRTLLELRDGSLLVGTFAGLFRFDPRSERFASVELGEADESAGRLQINDLLEDPGGDVWIATRYLGLIRLHADGRLDRTLPPLEPPAGNIRALAFDGNGGLWAGGSDGLRHLIPDSTGRLVPGGLTTVSDGLSDNQVYSLFRDSGDRLVVATSFGIALSTANGGTGPQFAALGPRQGLSLIKAIAVSEDRSGNFWVGSDGSGAFKVAQAGFTSFGAQDGLPGPYCVSFLHDRLGRLYASTHTKEMETQLSRLEGSPLPSFRINVPRSIRGRGWGVAQLTLQDHLGDWWIPTAQGLVRFSVKSAEELTAASPRVIYTMKDGLPSDDIFRIFEDSHGVVWVGANGLARFDRASGRFEKLGSDAPHSFGEDASGNVWIGGWDGDLMRVRQGGMDRFTASDGAPKGAIETVFRDSRDRLWIGSSEGGVARVDDPASPHPTFVHLTRSQGLSSNQVNAVTEDRWGRIYLGTARGVDMLDPATGRIRHFTTDDGLAGSEITIAAADASGNLWFGTQAGLSRLTPRPPEARRPPPVWISSLSISGVRQPINLLGEISLEGLNLDPSQHDIEIGFVGLDYSAGEKLRYRYRLQGAEEPWSDPADRRSVNYANLSGGHYRFAVKAVDSDGQESPHEASVSFTILPPLWQRGWFLALLGILTATLVYALHRYRVSHLLKVERVRTRIASDLHDDIGASLSRIAMQSDLVRLPEVVPPAQAQRLLADIGESARTLVDSLSDIVWSIDPKRDDLASLAARIRRFALGMFEPLGVVLELKVPEGAGKILLAPEDRRHLLLILKEAIHNVARHSGCRHVWITLASEGSRLRVEVRDDGRGFAEGAAQLKMTVGGHGLKSMASRAEQLRGSLRVDSSPGQGTTLRLTCNLQQSRA